MSQIDLPTKAPDNPSTAMIITLGGIAMLSGLLVVAVFQFTKPYIEHNQRIATERGVFKVVPGAVAYKEFVVSKDGIAPASSGKNGTPVFAGYDNAGKLMGVAARAGAQGYADIVHILYGYDPACQCIRGIKVLKSAETPGLGDKIITDASFQQNFVALDARLNNAGTGLANAIVTVKHGSKKHPYEIDAISGATISSRAVGKALDTSAQQLVPLLQRDLPVLQSGMTAASGRDGQQ